MKYKFLLLPLILIMASCNQKNTNKYNLLDIKNNQKTTDFEIQDIPEFYFDSDNDIDNLVIFTDTLDFQTVEIEHTGEKWGDNAQIYKGASYIEINFPSSLKVFSYDWPQPALSSNSINTEITSKVTEKHYFTSPIVIKLEHQFRNPVSKKSIEQKRTFDTGIGIGFEDEGKVNYYLLKFISRVDLKHKGEFLKYKK